VFTLLLGCGLFGHAAVALGLIQHAAHRFDLGTGAIDLGVGAVFDGANMRSGWNPLRRVFVLLLLAYGVEARHILGHGLQQSLKLIALRFLIAQFDLQLIDEPLMIGATTCRPCASACSENRCQVRREASRS
jgi:hypothetical protein